MNADILVKIVKAKLIMQVDENLDDMSIEEIAEGAFLKLSSITY